MQLADVNILVYAHREESPHHEAHRDWLHGLLNGVESYAISDFVLTGFLRLVTNPKVFGTPTPLNIALNFCDKVRHRPQATIVVPGRRHWTIMSRLCQDIDAKPNDIPDAYLAALAIEHGCEFVTADKGFRRFNSLRLRHVPLSTAG